jgi:hypothetical protein
MGHGGPTVEAASGTIVRMPANVPHAVDARDPSRMLLIMHSGLIVRPSVSHYRFALHLVLALAIVGLCVWMIRVPRADAPVVDRSSFAARLTDAGMPTRRFRMDYTVARVGTGR